MSSANGSAHVEKWEAASRKFDSRALRILFDDSIFEFFSQTPYVGNLLVRFRAAGIRNVGDLISYRENELYRKIAATPASRKRIRDALNECGLDFAGNKPPSFLPFIRKIDRSLKRARPDAIS